MRTVWRLVVVGALVLAAGALLTRGGRRLPRRQARRPLRAAIADQAPVVVVLPAHDEGARIGAVLDRIPRRVLGRPVELIVVDDGSTDDTAAVAQRAGARVVGLAANEGLGAALRHGLAEASARRPACVVYLDADGEYPPDQVPDLAAAVLAGADYVVGSRFAGPIGRMLPHRRFGNILLTRWVRWMTRRRDLTDGQSGMRAFSAEAAASARIRHDYNYAQVLTLNLLGQGFSYAEVPIDYAFRTSGRSFISLGCYLRAVVPAVRAELRHQSSTTCRVKRSRDAAQAGSSRVPSVRSDATAA